MSKSFRFPCTLVLIISAFIWSGSPLVDKTWQEWPLWQPVVYNFYKHLTRSNKNVHFLPLWCCKRCFLLRMSSHKLISWFATVKIMISVCIHVLCNMHYICIAFMLNKYWFQSLFRKLMSMNMTKWAQEM